MSLQVSSGCRSRLLALRRRQIAAGVGALADTFMAKGPSVEDRLAAGKALRKKVPRTSHAEWKPRGDRPDSVSTLKRQNVARVPKLVPVRYARTLVTPFTFLRGSAAVMADDLSGTPVTGLQVAACGDMHVSNFGVYASAERSLIFAINDFDEIHPGPWERDLKRLAARAAVAARFMGGDKAEAAARECVRAYRKRMARHAGMGYRLIVGSTFPIWRVVAVEPYLVHQVDVVPGITIKDRAGRRRGSRVSTQLGIPRAWSM